MEKEKKEKTGKLEKISKKINEKAEKQHTGGRKKITFDWSGLNNTGEPGYRNFDFSDIPGFRD